MDELPQTLSTVCVLTSLGLYLMETEECPPEQAFNDALSILGFAHIDDTSDVKRAVIGGLQR